MIPDQLSYTIEQAAEAIGVSRSTLCRLITTNQINTFKVGKRRLISVQALQAFIARKEKEAELGIAA